MAFDFPSSPTVNQQFTPIAGTSYVYNGYGWVPGGHAPRNILIQPFTANGIYVPSVGMQFCIVETVGGGGAGGAIVGAANNAICGGGGGAGGYSRKLLTAAAIGASQSITIGAGGIAGDGGDTLFGSLCIAKGGKLGQSAAPYTYEGGAGGVTTGAVGDVVAAGAPGHVGVALLNSSGQIVGGAGGSSVFGGGASVTGARNMGAIGNAGNNYGSGGAGGYTFNAAGNFSGGDGSAGIVIITEYIW